MLSQHRPWFLQSQEETALRWISQLLINHVPVPLILLSSCAPTHILSIFSLFFCLAHSILLLLLFLKVGTPLPSDPLFCGGTLGSCSDLNSDLNLKKKRLLPVLQPRLEVHVHSSDKASSLCSDPCQRCISLGKSQKCVTVSAFCVFLFTRHSPATFLTSLSPPVVFWLSCSSSKFDSCPSVGMDSWNEVILNETISNNMQTKTINKHPPNCTWLHSISVQHQFFQLNTHSGLDQVGVGRVGALIKHCMRWLAGSIEALGQQWACLAAGVSLTQRERARWQRVVHNRAAAAPLSASSIHMTAQWSSRAAIVGTVKAQWWSFRRVYFQPCCSASCSLQLHSSESG